MGWCWAVVLPLLMAKVFLWLLDAFGTHAEENASRVDGAPIMVRETLPNLEPLIAIDATAEWSPSVKATITNPTVLKPGLFIKKSGPILNLEFTQVFPAVGRGLTSLVFVWASCSTRRPPQTSLMSVMTDNKKV